MKVAGIIFIVLGCLNLIVAFIALFAGEAEFAGQRIGGALMLLVLGLFLRSRAINKAKEEEEKNKWNNNTPT